MADPRSGRKWAEFAAKYWKSFGSFHPPCALCGEIVNTAIRGRTNPWARSIDHIIPVEHGGKVFDPHNCQPAHRLCNTSRGLKPATEFNTPQKRQSFRRVVEALAAVQEAKLNHSHTLTTHDEAAGQERTWAPWGWHASEGITPVGEFYWKCCNKPAPQPNITHNCAIN